MKLDIYYRLHGTTKDDVKFERVQPPQRIKGRWVQKESDLSWWYECSECGESPLFDPYEHEVRSSFCPWCGADMRQGEGDEANDSVDM